MQTNLPYIAAFARSMPKAELILEDLLLSGQIAIDRLEGIKPAQVGGRVVGFNILVKAN